MILAALGSIILYTLAVMGVVLCVSDNWPVVYHGHVYSTLASVT
jgi:hypothetical protein